MTHYPSPFLSRMRTLLGDEYDAFCAAMDRAPERGLRLNPLRAFDASAETVPWEPNGRYVSIDLRPGQDLSHFSGAYYMQDPSAMAPARVLDAQPGELVLDLCAAPGGKSGQIAVALQGRGVLVSNEPDAARAKALSSNLERLGVPNALVVSAYPDALARHWPAAFDAVLVDAPCSGEGMFRKDAAARAEWSESSPAGCAQRQSQILAEAAKMLRPGGRLVYSTCTFNQAENEGVIGDFLERHGMFAPVNFALDGVGQSKEGMLRLWPHKLRGEGHFVAMVRKADAETPTAPQLDSLRSKGAGDRASGGGFPQPDPLCAQLQDTLPGSWPNLIEGWTLELFGDILCALPPRLPATSGLKTLRTGLQLCRVGKGYVKPDHALAMALRPGQSDRTLDLDEAAARRFARGEEVPCEASLAGWTLVTHNSLPIGWGKAVQGTLKNHIPKGIRMV